MRVKRNLRVQAKTSPQVLRRKTPKKSTQHLSAEKKPKVQRSSTRPTPSDLGKLIDMVNQVPNGLPSLQDLRELAEDRHLEAVRRGRLHSRDADLDRLILQEAAKMPQPLREWLGAPPDTPDEQARLEWRVQGRYQLHERYDDLTQVKLALVVIASGRKEIGPFHFETWLREDEKGMLQPLPRSILEHLTGVERNRIRQCPICEKIYWAGRTDQPTCTKRCNNVRRSRIQRGTFSHPEGS